MPPHLRGTFITQALLGKVDEPLTQGDVLTLNSNMADYMNSYNEGRLSEKSAQQLGIAAPF